MNISIRNLVACAAAAALLLSGCVSDPESENNSNTLSGPFGTENQTAESKYADMSNWIRFESNGTKEADIFVIYPSVQGSDPEDSPYFRLNSPQMISSATAWVTSLCGRTGVPGLLTSHTNVYAPLYRQANLFSGGGGQMGATPYADLAEAFNYYYETINKGSRPFIIYGFSQGGYLAIELATRLLADTSKYSAEYNKNHVITYAPGMAVAQTTINRNSRLKFSQSYNDVGVIVSWNSIAPSEVPRIEASTGFTAPYGTLVRNGLVTNPIIWTTDSRAVPASENKRSYPGISLQANYCGAQAKNVVNASGNSFGILLILEREEAGGTPSTTNLGKYHGSDERFFYESIMDNIKARLDAFKAGSGTAVREIRGM